MAPLALSLPYKLLAAPPHGWPRTHAHARILDARGCAGMRLSAHLWMSARERVLAAAPQWACGRQPHVAVQCSRVPHLSHCLAAARCRKRSSTRPSSGWCRSDDASAAFAHTDRCLSQELQWSQEFWSNGSRQHRPPAPAANPSRIPSIGVDVPPRTPPHGGAQRCGTVLGRHGGDNLRTCTCSRAKTVAMLSLHALIHQAC